MFNLETKAQGYTYVLGGCDDPYQLTVFVTQVKLYSSSGSLKYTSDCAPKNGYFLVPLYDRVCLVMCCEAYTLYVYNCVYTYT